MIKYLFLAVCTMIALVIKDYVASISIYVVGLILYEEFSAYNLQETLATYLGNLFVSLTEVGDCHTFSSENKYGWSYV